MNAGCCFFPRVFKTSRRPICWNLMTTLFHVWEKHDFMLKPFLWPFPQNRPSPWTPSLHPTPRPRSSSSGNLPTIPTETSLTTWSFASASLKPVSFTSSTTVRRVSHIVCSTSLAPVWEVLRAMDCFVCLDRFGRESKTSFTTFPLVKELIWLPGSWLLQLCPRTTCGYPGIWRGNAGNCTTQHPHNKP